MRLYQYPILSGNILTENINTCLIQEFPGLLTNLSISILKGIDIYFGQRVKVMELSGLLKTTINGQLAHILIKVSYV